MNYQPILCGSKFPAHKQTTLRTVLIGLSFLLLTGCNSDSNDDLFDQSIFSTTGSSEPFSSTVFIEPDILTQDAPSNFLTSTFQGLTPRSMFDSRAGEHRTTDAYVYSITFTDGGSLEALINSEFNDETLASLEAQRFGHRIGQLPNTLRSKIEELWIHKGRELWGSNGRGIFIHTDITTDYDNAGILEETLLHEAVHVALDNEHEDTVGWKAAQTLDDNFISSYAKDNASTEDFSESFLMWMAVRFKTSTLPDENRLLIEQAIPARLIYLDQQGFDMSPVAP